jgi:cysteine dioxygenase
MQKREGEREPKSPATSVQTTSTLTPPTPPPPPPLHYVILQPAVIISDGKTGIQYKPSLQNQGEPCLNDLVTKLDKAFAFEKSQGHAINVAHQPTDSFTHLDASVRKEVSEYLSKATDWKQFCKWSDEHYQRHLIEHNDDYELLLLCWSPGQSSSIHDHPNSHCWLTSVYGQVKEIQYRPLDVEKGEGSLVIKTAETIVQRGQTGYINDTIGLHAVQCDASCERAATLHLYSPPLRHMRIYDGKYIKDKEVLNDTDDVFVDYVI